MPGGFKKLVGKLEKKGKSADQAKGIAAKVGREKFGAKKFAAMAAKGKKAAVRKVRSA